MAIEDRYKEISLEGLEGLEELNESFDGVLGVGDNELTNNDIEELIEEIEQREDGLGGEETTEQDNEGEEVINECDGEVEEDTDVDMVMYLVIDKDVKGMVNYFRECGVNVSNIFNSIVDARNAILMQAESCRIVIVDTGLGKFTSTKIRQELIDMLGICDENNKVAVFYTDSVIKVDTLRALGKDKIGIDWFKYSGAADVAAKTLEYGEKYILDSFADGEDTQTSKEEINSLQGTKTDDILEEEQVLNEITSEIIIENMMESDEGLLPKYEVIL